jgi:3-deoxy-D-manno-octulosonate 8-phosphate phosphatase (KDO 8-P phosphatase)
VNGALQPQYEATILARAAKIRCLFLDIDGVMTDCKLYLAEDGSETKAVNVRDGYGIKQLLRHGVEVAVISGRPSTAMAKRLASLGVPHVYLDTEHKLPAYEEVKARLGIGDEACAHVGDDMPDMPLFERVGLAVAVADAHWRARQAAHLVSVQRGGDGAIREAADLILQAQGLA